MQFGAWHCCGPLLRSDFSYHKREGEAINVSKVHQQPENCTKSTWEAEGYKENTLSGRAKAIKKAFLK